MSDVTIPADVAKAMASFFRQDDEGPSAAGFKMWADLLDPRPASLREQVADCLVGLPEVRAHQAGLVLAVVADAPIEQILALVGPRLGDWLAAQPLHLSPFSDNVGRGWNRAVVGQRDADVALIQGEAS